MSQWQFHQAPFISAQQFEQLNRAFHGSAFRQMERPRYAPNAHRNNVTICHRCGHVEDQLAFGNFLHVCKGP